MSKIRLNEDNWIICPHCECEMTHIMSVDIESSDNANMVKSIQGLTIVSNIDSGSGGKDVGLIIHMHCEECGGLTSEQEEAMHKAYENKEDYKMPPLEPTFSIILNHHEGATTFEVE